MVGEELGLVGAVLIMGLFFALAWYGFRAAGRAPDRFGCLVAVGVTTWITSQAVINIGAVVGVLPVTGIPLPFISFGGSSLVITLAAVGILMNIALQERRADARPPSGADSSGRDRGHAPPTPGAPREGGGTPWWRAGARPATCSRPWPSPRRWSTRATPAGPSSSSGPSGARTPPTLAGRGFPVTLLPGRGIVRSLAPRDLVENVGSVAELLVAAVRAVTVVGRARPRVVVAVGGYASLAGRSARVVRRVPLVLVNVDAVPGAANRLLGRFAAASAVGWEGTPLPRAVVTGTPVRPEIGAVDRSPGHAQPARAELGLPGDRQVVAVFGGSLGARRINEAVDGLAERWAGRATWRSTTSSGRRDWGRYAPAPGSTA